MEQNKSVRFPDGFLWGAATSAYQVEGMNTASDWWAWEQDEIKKPHPKVKDASGKACDHYNRFDGDFALAERLGHNAHRFSIEWARIQPHEGEWSMEAVAHYKEVFASLRAHHLEPFVTMYHFTLPQWIAERGGWLNPRIVEWFRSYAEFLMEHLGAEATFWATMNEPLAIVDSGFRRGVWAPGRASGWSATIRSFWNMRSAHRAAYEAARKIAKEKSLSVSIGVVHNLVVFEAYNKRNIADRICAAALNFIFVRAHLYLFLKPADFLGANFYFKTRSHFDIRRPQEMLWGRTDETEPRSDMGWAIRPDGIAIVLRAARSVGVPIYITENGIADKDDSRRSDFIVKHLRYVHEAIAEGADVRGYFYWSLLDNFEWAWGFEPRFGLCEVDYSDFSRTPRKSAFVYEHIARNNALEESLM